MEKKDFRRVKEEVRFALRKKGIQLLKSGKRKMEVAEIIGVLPHTISIWAKKHEVSGAVGLKEKSEGLSRRTKNF